MHPSAKAETLRLMLRTAKALRMVATATADANEAALFLRGALVLESRAHALAYEDQMPTPEIHTQIDFRC